MKVRHVRLWRGAIGPTTTRSGCWVVMGWGMTHINNSGDGKSCVCFLNVLFNYNEYTFFFLPHHITTTHVKGDHHSSYLMPTYCLCTSAFLALFNLFPLFQSQHIIYFNLHITFQIHDS